jgi:DNA-directed RNA polymerase subunit RPC12/RpoP
MAKEQIGVYDCWSCGKEIPVKKTASGKLSAPCTWCDFPHYANPGTEHFKRLMAKVRLDKKAEPPAPPPAEKKDEKPAPKPAERSPFRPPFGG